jgi:hypothetical protein
MAETTSVGRETAAGVTAGDVREYISRASDDLEYLDAKHSVGTTDPNVLRALELVEQANRLLSDAYDAVEASGKAL